MTNREKAMKTYQELQLRKKKKEQQLKNDLRCFRQDTFFKCYNARHDLKAYR